MLEMLKQIQRSLFSVVAGTHLALQAQPPINPKFQDHIVYDLNGSWVFLPQKIENKIQIHYDLRQKTLLRPFNAALAIAYRHGQLWSITSEATGPNEVVKLLKYDPQASKTWEVHSTVDCSKGHPGMMIPLDEKGKFLAIDWLLGFSDGPKSSFAAIFVATSDGLRLEKTIDLNFRQRNVVSSQTFSIDETPESPIIPFAALESPALQPNLWPPAQLPDHVALGSTQAGLVWLLSLKDGSLRRVVDLGRIADRDLRRLKPLRHWLLGLAASPDGHLIAATRDWVLIDLATAQHLDDATPEAEARIREHFESVASKNPVVLWWDIDPETGEATLLEDPTRLPQLPKDLNPQQLRFLVDPKGRIHRYTRETLRQVLERWAPRNPAPNP